MARFLWILIVCLFVVFQVGAQNVTLSDVPTCPLECLIKALAQTDCGFTDTNCQCSSQILFDTTSSCVLDTCSKSDGIKLSKFQAQLCQRKSQSRRSEVLGFIYGGLPILIISATLRFMSRWLVHRKLFLDDYMMLAAIALRFALTVTSIMMVMSGFGEHIYQVHINEVSKILFLVWLSEMLYVLLLVFVKLALLLFFLRIFPQKWFRVHCKILIVIVPILGLMWVLLLVFQCHPIAVNWDINAEHLQCINLQAVAYAGAGNNIVQDLWIMLLPVPLLLKIRVTTSRKLALLAMFSVGIFVLMASCARLGSIEKFGKTADATWDDVNITIWTTVEIDTALFCCNMPSISALIAHFRRKSQESKLSKKTPGSLLPSNGYPRNKDSGMGKQNVFPSSVRTVIERTRTDDEMELELVDGERTRAQGRNHMSWKDHLIPSYKLSWRTLGGQSQSTTALAVSKVDDTSGRDVQSRQGEKEVARSEISTTSQETSR